MAFRACYATGKGSNVCHSSHDVSPPILLVGGMPDTQWARVSLRETMIGPE